MNTIQDHAEAHNYRNLVLEKLEQMGLAGLREHIVFEEMITSMIWRHAMGRNAVHGFSSNNLFAPFTRPQNRASDLPGLYFAGGSVHPGGGLPLVMLSGKLAAELVAKDLTSKERK